MRALILNSYYECTLHGLTHNNNIILLSPVYNNNVIMLAALDNILSSTIGPLSVCFASVYIQ